MRKLRRDLVFHAYPCRSFNCRKWRASRRNVSVLAWGTRKPGEGGLQQGGDEGTTLDRPATWAPILAHAAAARSQGGGPRTCYALAGWLAAVDGGSG